jgi:hypothetical protein
MGAKRHRGRGALTGCGCVTRDETDGSEEGAAPSRHARAIGVFKQTTNSEGERRNFEILGFGASAITNLGGL